MSFNELSPILLLKVKLAQKRGFRCEECGEITLNLSCHHWIQHRMKGRPELDVEENLGLVCQRCHSTIVNSYESRKRFWKRQIDRGYDMQTWLDNLPLKVKENFD